LIKKVSTDDLKIINKLEKRIFKSESFSKSLLKKLIDVNSLFLKLIKPNSEKDIIGYVILIKDEPRRLNLINFAIRKKYQNKGYGSILLNKTLYISKQISEINKVILNVKTTNNRAINLYKKFGFRIVDRIEDYYRQNESAYLMELKI
jgi:ribosomal-protein-alanine N-acetyltransferase